MSKRKLRVLLGTSLLFFGNGLFGAAGPTFRSMEPEVIACDFGRSSMFPKTGVQERTRSGIDSPFQCRVLKQEMTIPTGFDSAQPLGPWHDGRTLFLPPSLDYEATYRLGHSGGRNEVELLAIKTWLYDDLGNLVEINYPEDFPGINLNDYLNREGVTARSIPDDVDWMPRDIETLAANLRQPLRAEEPAPAAARNTLLNNANFTPIQLTSPEISIGKIDIQLDMEKSEIHVGDTIRVAEWEKGSKQVTDEVVEKKIERKLDGTTFSVSAKSGGTMEAFAPGSWEIRHLYNGDFAYAIYVGSQNIVGGGHSEELTGLTNSSKIYLVPSANYAAGTALAGDDMQITFSNNAGAIHYTSDQSGSPLAINTNSKHYLGNKSDTGTPVLAANTVTWKNKTININLGANPTVDDRPFIWSDTNAAFGQNATPEQEQAGSLPYRVKVDDTFVSPNISLTGAAELRGTKAIELVAMKDAFIGDYGNAASRAAGRETEADFGKITVGSDVVLDGGVLQQLFAHGFQGNFASNRDNSFGGIDLQAGSTVKGSVIIDGSIWADGTVKLESMNRIAASNIAGKIESRNEDSVGFCESLAGWFDASKIDSSGAGATLQIDDVTITGEIGNGTATQPGGSYTAVLLDGACHNTGTTAADGGPMGEAAKIQSGVGQVNISKGAKIVATATAAGELGTGVAVHTDEPSEITIDGGSGTPNSIKAAGIGVLVDAGRKGSTLKLANTSIENTRVDDLGAAAIVARNTAIEVGDDVTLKGNICGIDSDEVMTYAYGDGATSIAAVNLPEGSSSGDHKVQGWNYADLKKAQLDLDVKLSAGKEFRTGEWVCVTNYTQGAACRGTASYDRTLMVGQSVDVSGGTFTASAIDWRGEPGTATPDHLRLNAKSMDELTVISIYADGVRVAGGGDAAEKCPEIEVCGKDPTVRYVGAPTFIGSFSGIEGNNSAADKDYAKYVQLKLTGAGGIIGTATKLGEIRIEAESDQGIWTIEGETSCARLTIGKGKLHQLGKLTIWGDMLLLGCDIDWKDSVFNGGIYAPEDTIFARAGSKALIRNGFASSDESLINDLQYVSERLNGEGILLDGTARFVVDENARAVNFQIVGVSGKDSSPVAIRVAKSRPDAAQVDNSNSIELNRSLNIQYYGRDGKIYCGTPTAIWGTRQTVLNLNRGTKEDPNFFRGSVRNVGRIEVNGNWRLLDGLRDCGHLRVTRKGSLDLGRSMLDVRTLSIFVDPKREDAYLTCAGFLRDTVLEMRFDESILLNPNAQSYLLVDGLTDVAATQSKIHQLNIGGFSFTGEGENLYLTFAADDNVTLNNPRRIYYLGGYLREDDDAIDGESSEERQYNEMRRKEAARATDGSTNSEDNEDLFHSTNLRQLALRDGEPADAGQPSDPSANAGNPPTPEVGGGSAGGNGSVVPAPAIASWSLQQAEIVGQQINQVRQLLLTHDFDPMHGTDNYMAYIQPFGGFSKRKDISDDLKEVKADRYGVLLGAQKYLQGGIFVQGAIGYGWTDDSFEQGEFSRDCKTESILVAAEAAYRFENLNVRLVGTFGSDKYKYDRLVDGKVLHSEFDGYSAGGALQADYLVPFHGFLVGPIAEVSYDYIRQDGYKSETEGLEVGKFSARNGKVRLGLRFEQQTAGQMPYCVYGTASWLKTPYRRGLTSTMKVGSGSAVQADDIFLSREAFEGRLGVRLQMASGWNLDGFYNVVNQKNFIDHAFSVQFSRQF